MTVKVGKSNVVPVLFFFRLSTTQWRRVGGVEA